MNVERLIRLSNLLAKLDSEKRATKLPSGEFESDSHHAFSLALIAYHICISENLALDHHKVVLFALAHDLLEIITGDVDTLHFTAEQHAQKQRKEQEAIEEFDQLFRDYPELLDAMHEYEKLDTPEAATVFVLDKVCTTWTHHADKAAYARAERNLLSADDIEAWAQRQCTKFTNRLRVMPPKEILDIYDSSFEALKQLYDT